MKRYGYIMKNTYIRNTQGFTLIELMIVVAIIGILAAIAIPQYQNYVAKTQVTRAMGEISSMKAAVEFCLLNGQMVLGNGNNECEPQARPSTILTGASQVGNPTPAGMGNPQVLLDANLTTITSTFGNTAAPVITNNTLTWSRNATGSWTCATNVASNYKPTGCLN